MQTSLFKQLEQLKTTQTARDLKKNRYPSILFPFHQAANFDVDTIRNIASQGLTNLVIHNPSLQSLREKLFNPDMDNLSRDMLTNVQNQEISEFVQEIVRDLAPYFLLEDCQKVFEYLLRHFEVHNYEADYLIVTLLPYHSTIFYVKLLQNINLNKSKHWFFMEKSIKEGLVVPRSLIAKQCVLDSSILELITKSLIKAIESKAAPSTGDIFFNVGGSASKGLAKIGSGQKNVEINFGVLLAVETISYAKEKKKVSENLLLSLIKFLSFCLKSQNTEVFRAGLIVILQLTSTTSLSLQYLSAIVLDVSKKLGDKSLVKDILLLLVYVYQMNDSFAMPNECFKEITKNLNAILPCLLEVSQQFSITNIFLAFSRNITDFDISKTSEELNSSLIQAFSKLLKATLDSESRLQDVSKRLQLTKILIEKIFEKLVQNKNSSKDEKTALIDYLSKILIEVKNNLPDQVTDALKDILQNNESFQNSAKLIQRFLKKSFSKLYLEGVLGVELLEANNESEAEREQKELLPSISPYYPISANMKLKALQRVEALLEESMEVEGEESLKVAVGDVVLSHFRTHSYNEQVIETLLSSQKIQNSVEIEKLAQQIVVFVKKYYKTPLNAQVTGALKQIYHVLIHRYAELSEETKQEVKELIVDTLFSERALVLKDNLKQLKKVLPIFFKPIQAAIFESDAVAIGALTNYKDAISIEGLVELEEEYTRSKSANFQELVRLIEVSILQRLPESLAHVPEHLWTLLSKLRDFKPKRIQTLCQVMERVAKSLQNLDQKKLKNKQQLFKVVADIILFLLNVQSTDVVPIVKVFVDLFGEDKLVYLLIIAYQMLRKNQDKHLVIIFCFINNIIASESFNNKDLFHETLLVIPFLEVANQQVRQQALQTLKKLGKTFKRTEGTFQASSFGEFYQVNLLVDNLFEAQVQAAGKASTVPAAQFHKFLKNILKYENELTGSSTSNALSQILEKLISSFTDFEWLFNFIVGNLFAAPVKELFDFSLEVLSFLSTKFNKQVSAHEETKKLLTSLAKIAANVSPKKEALELLGALLTKFGKTFSDSESEELLNTYFKKVYTKAVHLCTDSESPLLNVVLQTFGKDNYARLADENQLEFLDLMSHLASRRMVVSTVLTSCLQVEPSDELLIQFGEKVVAEFKISGLTFLSELLHFLNRKSLKYLPLLNQIYNYALTQVNQEGLSFIQETHYALALIISLHKNILSSVIEAKTPINYSKVPQESQKKKNNHLPLKSVAGEFEANEYQYVTALKNLLASTLAIKTSDTLLQDAEIFVLIKGLFDCLTVYTFFLFDSVSKAIASLLLPILSAIESKGPRAQVNSLRLLKSILQLSRDLLKNQFELYPYVKLLMKVLQLKEKLPTSNQTTIKSKDYYFIEIEKEISQIISTVGQNNLDYIVYGLLSNILGDIAANKPEDMKQKIKLTSNVELSSAIQIIFSSDKLEESVNILNKILLNAYNLTAYYLSRTIEFDKKKKKVLFKASSALKGRSLAVNYGITKLPTLRSFLTVLIYLGERCLQSKEFMKAFSGYLVKGNLKTEVSDQFASLIVSLVDEQGLISQALSKLQAQKVSQVTATKLSVTAKKRSKARNFLKKINNFSDRLLETLQELLPEELLASISCRIFEKESALKTKSKTLQIFHSKLTKTGSPRITPKTLEKLRGLLEGSLADNQEEYLQSRTAEVSSYLQSIFLCLGIVLKKKGKAFEDGLQENVFEYMKHPVFPVRCSVFYVVTLFIEKYPNQALEKLSDLVNELLFSILVCAKSTEQQSFETLAQLASEKNMKILNEVSTKAQSYEEEIDQGVENCLVLCLNSLLILLKTLKDMMNPYIPSLLIILSSLKTSQTRVDEILGLIASNIEPRNLVDPLLLAGDVQHQFSTDFGRRVAVMAGKVCESMDKDTFESKNQTLFKLFIKGLDYMRVAYQETEEDLTEETIQKVEEVQAAWTEAFSKFALKTTEVQLKKYFLKLNEWSSKSVSAEDHKFNILRKIAVFELVVKLYDTLRGFFNQYMAFFYDFCLDQLTHYAQAYKSVEKGLKRRKADEVIRMTWEARLHKLVLMTFTKCFTYDKEHDFIDSNKFDKIVEPLVDQLDCVKVPMKYTEFIDSYVQPSILQLFEQTQDDYKWKSLNYAILMKTRSEIGAVKLSAIKTVLKMVEQLRERSAVLIHDILPFLSETLEDEDIQVEKISKEIVVRLEQITGENIQEYLRS